MTEQDANILQTFGPGQGIVSGQAVAFPLLVQVQDDQLRTSAITDEDFINDAQKWRPDQTRAADDEVMAEDVDEEPAPEAKPRPSGAKEASDGTSRPAKKPIKLKASRRPPSRR